MKRKLLSTLIAVTVLTMSTCSAIAFSDTKGHWAEEKIRQYTSAGLVRGYPDNTFRPNAQVSRAESMQFYWSIVSDVFPTRLLVNYYPENISGKWYEKSMAYGLEFDMYDLDWWSYSNPNKVMTRGDIANHIGRMLRLNDLDIENKGCFVYPNISNDSAVKSLTEEFKDLKGDEVNIAETLNWNIFKGYPDGTFRPGSPVSRSELLVIAERVREIGVKEFK